MSSGVMDMPYSILRNGCITVVVNVGLVWWASGLLGHPHIDWHRLCPRSAMKSVMNLRCKATQFQAEKALHCCRISPAASKRHQMKGSDTCQHGHGALAPEVDTPETIESE